MLTSSVEMCLFRIILYIISDTFSSTPLTCLVVILIVKTTTSQNTAKLGGRIKNFAESAIKRWIDGGWVEYRPTKTFEYIFTTSFWYFVKSITTLVIGYKILFTVFTHIAISRTFRNQSFAHGWMLYDEAVSFPYLSTYTTLRETLSIATKIIIIDQHSCNYIPCLFEQLSKNRVSVWLTNLT